MCKTALAPELLTLYYYVPNIVISSKSVRPCLPSLHRRHFVLSRNSPPQQSCDRLAQIEKGMWFECDQPFVGVEWVAKKTSVTLKPLTPAPNVL